jgi:XTP/dITP diphosphohydrolase
MTLCFATNNAHKLEEVVPLLKGSFDLLSLDQIGCKEELPETQDTLSGNSFQKADFVFQNFNTPCFADDTGLEVEALNGAPGVYSARYAGAHRNSNDNINLLLENLRGSQNRKARFCTIITLVGLTPEPVFFEGIIEGEIIDEKRGNTGFGYDPVFVPNGHDLTFAEMSLEQKNTLSHRAIATKKLIEYLKNLSPALRK